MSYACFLGGYYDILSNVTHTPFATRVFWGAHYIILSSVVISLYIFCSATVTDRVSIVFPFAILPPHITEEGCSKVNEDQTIPLQKIIKQTTT